MARWEPDAAGRLREAAMQLYVERGFDQTTVADIAERAGVTSRTFFRHFTDKREVLFNGTDLLRTGIAEALAGAPADTSPIATVALALESTTGFVGRDHAHSVRRQRIIDAHAELRERELIKMADLGAALAAGLRERGVPEPDATLAAETGIVAFRVAFASWIADPSPGLLSLIRSTLARLTALTALTASGRSGQVEGRP
ncbi:TetR/AcrR family transcriptional regulator [Actinoplanes sp. NBRC 101535]|uniref:TetR/AcrR family transcriptional regulator n=1 Tax=Actinoplanes sp. NBRC 101535 TaxID=3032196 RepID=UPI0024A575D2|nr:TetR/AcrR family transcriptional regulator [Actinoplanes sp. NBRC 101535]GLY07383.1 TetR family transcriptional regulator [Actinoplanes sp. NBRC 101535]